MVSESKFTDDTIVEVWNTSSGTVSYVPEMSRVARRWERQGCSKKIKFGELVDIIGTNGGYVLFKENILYIKDKEIREKLGLPKLDKYAMNINQIKELLINKSADELEEVVQNCSDDMLDTITVTAIKEEVPDLNKVKILEDYTGIDVIGAIKENQEDKQATKTRTKRKTITTDTESNPPKRTRKKSE